MLPVTLKKQKKLLYSSVILFLSFALIEGFSALGVWYLNRQFHTDGLPMWVAEQMRHPFFGTVLRPEQWFPVNEFGFPGKDTPISPRKDNTVSVGIVGGSVASHFGLMGKKSLVSALQTSPKFAGKEIRVVNLAMGSWKQPQQLQVITYFLALGAKFDFIVNIDGFNELALPLVDNRRHGVHFSFPRAWYHLANRANRLRLPDWTKLSFTVQLVQRSLNRLNRAKMKGPSTPERGNEFAWLTDAVELWKQSSIQLGRLARANEIQYLHVLQPNQYFPQSKPMSAEEMKIAFSPTHPYREWVIKGYPMLQARAPELRDAQVAFHDLTMLFSTVAEAVYRDTCCHLNQVGNNLLAEEIARLILARVSEEREEQRRPL